MLGALRREVSQFHASLVLYVRLLPYVSTEWRLLMLTTAAMLATTVITLCQPWPLQVIVDSVLGPQPTPPWIRRPFGDVSKFGLLAIASGLMIGLLVSKQLVAIAQGYYSYVLGQRLVFTLRCDLYAKLQRLSLRFHDRSTVGDLVHRITKDADALQDILIHGFVPLVIQFLMVLALASAIFFLDVQLGFVALATLPLLIAWTLWYSERVKRQSRSLATAESTLYTDLSETLGSIRAVKSFTTEELELERFQRHARQRQEAYVRVVTLSALGGSVTDAIAGLGTVAVVSLGALSVLNADFTVGQLLVFVAYMYSLYGPATQLSGSALVIQRSSASIERVLEISDQEDEHATGGRLRLTTVSSHLAYQHVSFGYDPARGVLRDVSFEVRPGEMVAFVGPSGAGKTTLLSLLLRFYPLHSGRILLDRVDIATLDLRWLRRHIALVLQEPIIFSCSLGENIAYGRPGASRDDIVGASRAAGLHDFIMELPEGYDTCVGERGVRLSGGQRQRLSIARAFLKDAPVLILDEPTSQLDATTEQRIFQAFERLIHGRVTLVIAHRFSTVQRADRVIVMERGEIVEQGTHGELCSAGGPYARLYRDQLLASPPSIAQR